MELSDEMQRQARALADPRRFGLFRYLTTAVEPAGVAELTEHLGVTHNAVRQHLAVLLEAGLIVEADERNPVRGRPRKLYTMRDDALGAFGSVSGSYERLAELLLDIASSTDDPYDVGFCAESSGATAGTDDLVEVMDRLVRQLASGGFQPVQTLPGVTTLGNCPFASVASRDPAIVCELHRGLIDGFLATQSPGLTADLHATDPRAGGCTIKVRTRTEDGDSIPVLISN